MSTVCLLAKLYMILFILTVTFGFDSGGKHRASWQSIVYFSKIKSNLI